MFETPLTKKNRPLARLCPKFIWVRSIISVPWPQIVIKQTRKRAPLNSRVGHRTCPKNMPRSGQWFHKKCGHLSPCLLFISQSWGDSTDALMLWYVNLEIRLWLSFWKLLWQLAQYQRLRTQKKRKQLWPESITYPICFHLSVNRAARSEVRFFDSLYLASVMSCL